MLNFDFEGNVKYSINYYKISAYLEHFKKPVKNPFSFAVFCDDEGRPLNTAPKASFDFCVSEDAR